MAGPIANLSAVLKWDLDDFERGSTRVSNVFKGIIGLAGDVADAVASMGKRMTVGLTLPLGAIAALTTKAASDAAELQSAFDFTFGAMAGSMNQWADETGKALGRSTQQMQEGAFALGGLFKAAAPTEQAAARLSKKFTELAIDAGSFFNMPFDVALGKIRSGLAGETEPLRDFNIFINDSAVQAKALEMGLVSTGQELNEFGKIMARQALIAEGLAPALGDAERTAGSLANQVERLKSAFQGLSVEIGQILEPYAQKLAGVIERLVAWFRELPEGVKRAAVGFGVFLAALGPLSIVLSALAITILPAFLVGMGPVFAIISAIINPIGTFVVFAAKLAAELGGLTGLVGKLAPMFLRLTGPIGLVVSLLLMFKDEILAGVRTQMSVIAERVGPALQRFFDTLRDVVDRISDAFDQLAQSPLGEALEWISEKVSELIQITAEMGGHLIGTVLAAVIDLATGLVDYLGGAIETVVKLLSGDWTGAWEAAVETVSSAVIRIGEWVEGLFPVLGRALQMIGAISRAKLGDPTKSDSDGMNTSSASDQRALGNWLSGFGDEKGDRDYAVAGSGPKIKKPRSSKGRKGASGPSAEELADRREDLRLQQAMAVARESGNQDEERALQRQIDLRSRIDAYVRGGLSKQQAAVAAEKDMLAIDQARAVARAKAIEQDEERLDIQLAELRGDFRQIQALEDKAFIRRRIADLQSQGVALADAEAKAGRDLLALEDARLERAEARQRAEAEAHQIELARLRGDDVQTLRRLEEQQRIADRVYDLRSDRDNPMQDSDAMAQAMRESMDRERAYMQGTFRDTFRGGLQAALNGDLKGFFEGWMRDRSFNALSKVLDRLADRLADLVSGGGSGGGLGGILGGIGVALGLAGGNSASVGAINLGGGSRLVTNSGNFNVPKFNTGGRGQIKGFPGIDKNLLSLNGNPIAKVSSGELLNVQRNPANDGSGGSARVTIVPTPYFDAHVQGQAAQVAAPMSVRAAAAGSAGAQTSIARSRKRAMS